MKKKIFFTSIFCWLFILIGSINSYSQFTKLFDFSDDATGSVPLHGALISDGNYLYGMTSKGGSTGNGIIFRIKSDGSDFLRLYQFEGPNGAAPHGSLYFDGTSTLYGMTRQGGDKGDGTIFQIKTDGTGFLKIFDFEIATTGAAPFGGLISDGSFLYGTTSTGGSKGVGTIFKIKTDGGGFSVLHDFDGISLGTLPSGDLYSDGTYLYGMTPIAGLYNGGTLFRIKPDGTEYATLQDFGQLSMGDTNPDKPHTGALISDGSFLYGMTQQGGGENAGAIFRIKTDGGDFQKLHDFKPSSDGGSPLGALVSDGTFLYGVTSQGGASNSGTLFRMKMDGSGFETLVNFNSTSSGAEPQGTLYFDGSAIYGMTSKGGTGDRGTIFNYKLNSATITITQQPVNPNNRCEGQNFTFSTDAIGTSNITFQWQKFNTVTSLFENLTNNATYSGVNTKNLLITNVQSAQAGDYRCMIQGDFAPTVYCNIGTLTVNSVPAVPLVNNGSRCGSGQVTLSASGTSDGNYIWYGSNGMSEPIPGENNSIYLTPSLTATTTYYVSIVNSFCESALVPVDAVVNTASPAPTVANVANDGCGTQSFTLTATAGSAGTFRWYQTSTSTFPIETNTTGTYVTDDLSSTITYYVSFSTGTCESNRVPQTVTITNPGPGSLDNSFLPAGNSLGNFSAIDEMVLQSDGKIIVNYFETAGEEYQMVRLLPDGTLDPSFIQRPRSVFVGVPDLVNLQSDGKIIYGGRFTFISGVPYGRIVRLNTDGSIDGTFITGSGFNNSVIVITLQSDNKIIVGGTFTSYAGVGANRIIRINEDGSRDTGFVIGTGFNGIVRAIIVRPDGKILVGGSFTTYNGSPAAGIVLLNANGTIDNTFAPTGLSHVGEIALQSDGKILLYSNEGFRRLNADGTVDNSFSAGVFSAAVNTIYCEPSGKILVGGDFQSIGGITRYFVARINPNGSLDRYFNTGIGSYTWVYDILPAGTDQVFIAGYFDLWNNVPQNGIARINNDCMRTPLATDNAACGPSITLSACGGFDGDYRWYTTSTGGSPIAGETSSSITINNLTATTTYYVALNDGVCESARVPVVATSLAPAPPAVTGTSSCATGTFTLTATGGTDGQYRWYTSASGGTPITGEVNSTYTTSTITSSTTYYVSINDGSCESTRTAVTVTVTTPPAAPTAIGGAACGPSASITLTANGATNGEYRWYTAATGGTAITGEVNETFVTPAITATTTYYVAINNGSCESTRTAVTATINTTPAAPTTTGSAACGPSASITLTASGGTTGEYRWYSDATGGTAIAGQVNASFTTPSITTTTTYYVAINNGSCESSRTSVIATINSLPAKPVITLSGTAAICGGQSVTLTAPAGFTYLWSTGATTQQITVSTAGNFTVQVNNGTCQSVASDPAVITVVTCNQPPVITSTTATTNVEGNVTIDLSSLLSDPDDNLDLSSLRIIVPPKSGAVASIVGQSLVIDYSGVNFAGTDELTIEICDTNNACVQQQFLIDVAGDIVAYNGISPNGDDKNAKFLIKYIDTLPDTRENKVIIFNRWGDPVWEGVNYNNTNVVFTGQNKNGNDLPTGTYFYKIEFASGKSSVTGYLSLKR